MSAYFLGIDCGSTVIKAALFDQLGHEIFVARDRSETIFSEPGFAETHIEDTWQKAAKVCRTVVDESGVSVSSIRAVGVSGHGNGLYALDITDTPIVAVKSLDARASELCDAVRSQANYSQLRQLNHQGVWPAQTAMLLKWLKRNQPETYRKIATVLFCKDYINFKLTGVRSTEVGDLSASGLFDFKSHSVSTALLEILDIAEMKPCIPIPKQPEDIIGSINTLAAEQTGLMSGTPVIAGAFDVVANAIGSGARRHGQASVVVGSWSINQVVCKQLPSSDLFMTCLFPGQQYLAMENSATSAANLEWFVKTYIEPTLPNGADVFADCNRAVETVTIDESLPMFHPYLYGSKDSTSAGANFFGLRSWHGHAQMLYAIYEGILFGHMEHFDVLAAKDVHFSHVALSGGGARSEYWSQLFATGLKRTIQVTQCQEVGARGIAMLAAVATDFYENIDESIQHMARDSVEFAPNPEDQIILQQRYRKYLQISQFINQL